MASVICCLTWGETKPQGGGGRHAPSTRVFLGADFVPGDAECLDFVPVAFCYAEALICSSPCQLLLQHHFPF